MDQKKMDKITTGKVQLFFDWVWKIFVLNALTLVTSLGVVTFFPSLTACMASIKDFKQAREKNIFSTYFVNFKLHFKRSLVYGFIFMVLFAGVGYAVVYYSAILTAEGFDVETYGTVVYIAYYCSIFLLIIVSIIFSLMTLTLSYFHFRFRDNFKFTFMIGFRYVGKAIFMILVWGVMLVVAISGGLQIWFFLGLSFPLYMTHVMYYPIIRYLLKNKDQQTIIEGEEK